MLKQCCDYNCNNCSITYCVKGTELNCQANEFRLCRNNIKLKMFN